jgi:lysozyme
MRTNRQGIALIKDAESLRLKSYLCPGGVWTLGYGSTGPDIQRGMVWTEKQAEERLFFDLLYFEKAVGKLVENVNITGNQFSALVSFAYNVGIGAFRQSTLLRKLLAGDVSGAAKQFGRWNMAGGNVLPGLVARRRAERDLFLTPGDGDE